MDMGVKLGFDVLRHAGYAAPKQHNGSPGKQRSRVGDFPCGVTSLSLHEDASTIFRQM